MLHDVVAERRITPSANLPYELWQCDDLRGAALTTTRLIALEMQIAQTLATFRIKKTLMPLPPVDKLLRGIWFDRSAYDETSFSVTAFIMPLCILAKHLEFTFGKRIRHKGGGDRWSLEMPDLAVDLIAALRTQALPYLSEGETLEGFIEIARSSPRAGRTLEGLGFALARTGENRQAVEVFSQLVAMLDLNIAWQRDLADQVRGFSTKLMEHPEEALKQLIKWENESAHNLGLDEFRKAV